MRSVLQSRNDMDQFNTFTVHMAENHYKVGASINEYVEQWNLINPLQRNTRWLLFKHELDIYLMTDGQSPVVSNLRADMANENLGKLSSATLKHQ